MVCFNSLVLYFRLTAAWLVCLVAQWGCDTKIPYHLFFFILAVEVLGRMLHKVVGGGCFAQIQVGG